MAIKITFTKEMSVDLNAYYEQFSRKLKAAINEEVMALASGERKRASVTIKGKSSGGEPLLWRDYTDGKQLTHPLREAKMSEHEPARGESVVHFRALLRKFNGHPFLMGDASKFLRAEFPKMHASTILSNLWRSRSIEVKRVEDSAK